MVERASDWGTEISISPRGIQLPELDLVGKMEHFRGVETTLCTGGPAQAQSFHEARK
jgi:hypothetical protein